MDINNEQDLIVAEFIEWIERDQVIDLLSGAVPHIG